MNVRLRQDAIVRSLRLQGTTTVAQLAQDVGASKRTILRDISALRDEGVVIYSEPGRGGGLQLDPRSVQTRVRLSVSEVFALVVCVASVRATGGVPFSTLADLGLSKIEKALPTEQLFDLRRFLDCLYVGELAPQVNRNDIGAMEEELLPIFLRVLFLEQWHVAFEYCDAKGVRTEREVEPQAILILPPLWYLVAWDPTRSDFRHFRMDRIRCPKLVPEKNTSIVATSLFEDHVSPLRNLAR
ncbi:HTH domain-containing protein [Vibrio sinaloensis]|nr:HTH domain-containing protein [Vibrio sinaloensis]